MTDNQQIPPKSAKRIEILAFDMAQLLDVAGPLQVFATANDLARHRRQPSPYCLAVVAAKAPRIETSAGLGLAVAPLPDAESAVDESFGPDGGLEYPHYTRPREWEGRAIPSVLLSGDHAKIAAWRRAEAERITRERRPDLTER